MRLMVLTKYSSNQLPFHVGDNWAVARHRVGPAHLPGSRLTVQGTLFHKAQRLDGQA